MKQLIVEAIFFKFCVLFHNYYNINTISHFDYDYINDGNAHLGVHLNKTHDLMLLILVFISGLSDITHI